MSSPFASVTPEAFRQRRNLLLAYASEIASPLFRATARLRSRRPPSPRTEWKRGLILGHTHIGDILYRTCSLPVLRERLPRCEWSYAVAPGSADVLANNPHVKEVLPVITGENSWDLVDGGFAELSSRDFDVVLCSNTLRHYPDLAVATALGIPNRIAFDGKGFSGLMTQRVAMGFPDAYASYFRRMVGAVLDVAPDWKLRPRIYPSERNQRDAAELWTRFGLNGARPVVACSLRTRQAGGNWPDEVLIAILESARRQREFEVVFCGTSSDAADLKSIAAEFPFEARVLAGDADLLTFAAFLGRCSALLTLDSGPRHIGNAMAVPVCFARNLSHSRIEAGAYCETETDLAPPVEYLTSTETERVARSQPIELLADKLLEKLSASGIPA